MPQVDPKTINDLPKSERKRFTSLCYERTVMQYAFSYKKLIGMFQDFVAQSQLKPEYEEAELAALLKECVIAWRDEDVKAVKDNLNTKISDIFTENGIEKTLRYLDPFGRPKDYILMEGVSTSFSQSRALPIAVSGIFEWDCPACKSTNFTQGKTSVFCTSPSCKHFEHSAEAMKADKKLRRVPIAEIKHFKSHAMGAEAFQAIMQMATSKTGYVTLQARDVVEGKKDK